MVASGAPTWAYPKSWKPLSYTILSTLWKAHSAGFEESVERDSVGEGQAPVRTAGVTSSFWFPLRLLASKTPNPGKLLCLGKTETSGQPSGIRRRVETRGDGESQGLGMYCLSSSGGPHVTVDPRGPAPPLR